MNANIGDLMNLHFNKEYGDYQTRWAYFALFCRRVKKLAKTELSKESQKNSGILDILSELKDNIETYCLIDGIEFKLAKKIKTFDEVFDGHEELEQNQKADYIIQKLISTLDDLKKSDPVGKNKVKTSNRVHRTIK